jgi:hypothetical protein
LARLLPIMTLAAPYDLTTAELPVPARYEERLPQFAGRSTEPAYNVAHTYAQLLDDLAPDLAHAVRLHRLLDLVRQAAETGERLAVKQ